MCFRWVGVLVRSQKEKQLLLNQNSPKGLKVTLISKTAHICQTPKESIQKSTDQCNLKGSEILRE